MAHFSPSRLALARSRTVTRRPVPVPPYNESLGWVGSGVLELSSVLELWSADMLASPWWDDLEAPNGVPGLGPIISPPGSLGKSGGANQRRPRGAAPPPAWSVG